MQKSRHAAPFLARFSRVTTRGTFVPEIDGLRFVAVMAVILFHLAVNLASRNPVDYAYPVPGNPLHTVLRAGDLGVQLFFVVSGLVLALPFARHHILGDRPVRLRAYLMRRVTRLEPPYVLVMIGCFLLLVVVHGRSPGELGPNLLASLFYVHNLVYGQDSLINNVAWSLEVEIQFYLLVPWLTLLFAVRGTGRRRAVIVAAIVLSSILGPQIAGLSPHLSSTLLRYAQFFLIGFLLADLMVTGQLRRPRLSPAWDLLALAAFPVVVMLGTGTGLAGWLPSEAWTSAVAAVILPWLFFGICLAAFRGTALNAVLTLTAITTVGGMCYSIYLIHNVMLNNTLFLTKNLAPTGSYTLDFGLQALIMVPFIIAVSSVFFLLIERPCMNPAWPSRLAARLRSTRSVAHRLPDEDPSPSA